MSLLSITNSLIFSEKLKLKSSLLIIFMISKSIWKVLNLWLAPYTLFQHLNKRLWRNSLRKTSIWVSSNQPHLCIVHQSYSLRRKIVHYTSMSTSAVFTGFSKRIAIHFCISLSLSYRLLPPVWTMPDTATKPVALKVYNVKLSFNIWLVLYIHFILYFWQYSSFKVCNSYIKVICIAIHKDYAICCSYRALTVL